MLNACVEPLLEARLTLSSWQEKNAKPNLAENDWIDGDVLLVVPQPLDDTYVRGGLCRLTQNVSIDQISHSASVDSDSIGTKNPFSGHARSQSTTPSFGGGADARAGTRRVRR